ncbi:hypothetical protein AEST_18960 [Alishewanella aestuarii B11]|uniref:Uncharacterized protein n=1 Tax=Alishewanella aestuarii B11 TaxID=1197174 RepID=J2IEV4_9ALTE|nr:hypothetical protein AEST_18960 [Alishewanella aestuarii B11]
MAPPGNNCRGPILKACPTNCNALDTTLANKIWHQLTEQQGLLSVWRGLTQN